MRWRRGVGLCVVVAAWAVFGWATPASAHAAVISSSPPQGAHLRHVPRTVTITFDQPVQPDAGGIVVLDSRGQDVQTASQHPAPAVLRATLPASLGPGAYVANYTVTSVDGHVVSGGLVFLVGNVSAGAVAQLTRPHTSLTNWVDDGGQFLTYLGVLVASGLSFFLVFILGEASEATRLRRWAGWAAALGVAGLVVTAGAQAALIGGGTGGLAHWTVVRQAAGGKFGAQAVVQLAGLAACLAALRIRDVLLRQFVAFYGLLAAAGAFVLFGHAVVSPERWLSIPADVVHVVFAAMWAGGLVGLAVVLHGRFRTAARVGERAAPVAGRARADADAEAFVRASAAVPAHAGASTALLERPVPGSGGDRPAAPEPPAAPDGSVGGEDPRSHSDLGTKGDEGDAASAGSLLASTSRVVARFSTMAGISFAGILVAGLLLAIAEVGSVANLFETGYGQLLLVKLGVVGLLLLLAGYNRYLLLPWLFSQSSRGTPSSLARGWQRLSATMRWELVGMLAVLGVTAVLANGTPSNGATAPPPVPFAQTQSFDGGHVHLSITPNQALVNDWTVQFTNRDGAPADMAESVSLYLVLPSENIGPIETDMKKVGPGRFTLMNSPNPPVVGTWQIVLQVQVSAFSQPDVSFVDTVQ
jgi:putative copper export protein/methionine-rich copper-binding protein CopC